MQPKEKFQSYLKNKPFMQGKYLQINPKIYMDREPTNTLHNYFLRKIKSYVIYTTFQTIQ